MVVDGFKRKQSWWLFLFLFFGVISCISIFPFFLQQGIYEHDDFLFHKQRLEGFYIQVKAGTLFPKIYSEMAGGLGYGVGIFYPGIFLFPYACYRLLGFSFFSSYYMYLFSISFITGIFSYYFMQKISNNPKHSLLFSATYTLAIYRLMDQTTRGALGETLAFAFLPVAMLGLFYVFYSDQEKWYVLAVGMSLLIYSHNITAFAFFLLILIVFATTTRSLEEARKRTVALVKSGMLTLLLTVGYLVPILEQTSAITFNFSQHQLWSIGLNFDFGKLFLDSLSTSSGVWSNLDPNIGIFLLLVLFVALFSYKKLTKQTRLVLFFSLGTLITCTSLFPWSYFKDSFLGVIQFPWRLLMFASFFLALLFVLLIKDLSVSKVSSIVLLISLQALLAISYNGRVLYHLKEANVIFVTNENYKNMGEFSIGGGKEYLIKGTNYEELLQLEKNKVILSSDADTSFTSKIEKDKETYHFSIHSTKKQELSVPLLYYKGYVAKINDTIIPTKANQQGLVTFAVPQGSYQVSVYYKTTLLQRISFFISTITLIGFILFFIQITFFKKDRDWGISH